MPLAVQRGLEAAVARAQYALQKATLFVGLADVAALQRLVLMGDDHARVIHDKAVALVLDLKRRHHLLDAVHLHVQGHHVPAVGELSADGNDHVVGLRVHVGRHDDSLTTGEDPQLVPVPLYGIVTLRGLPMQAVQIFALDKAIETRVVVIKLPGLLRGLLDDVILDLRGCAAASQHEVHGVRRDPQRASGAFQIVVELRCHAGDPVLTYLLDVGHRHVQYDSGCVQHHEHHQAEDNERRNKQLVASLACFHGHSSSCRSSVMSSPVIDSSGAPQAASMSRTLASASLAYSQSSSSHIV